MDVLCMQRKYLEPLEQQEDKDYVNEDDFHDKDSEIADLKKALENSRNEASEVNAVKESLLKTKNELVLARKSNALRFNKIEFAKKITEQRMSNSLSSLTQDQEEELVTLYSTLVDEENFELKDGVV